MSHALPRRLPMRHWRHVCSRSTPCEDMWKPSTHFRRFARCNSVLVALHLVVLLATHVRQASPSYIHLRMHWVEGEAGQWFTRHLQDHWCRSAPQTLKTETGDLQGSRCYASGASCFILQVSRGLPVHHCVSTININERERESLINSSKPDRESISCSCEHVLLRSNQANSLRPRSMVMPKR
jgi:hypothetical protein